MTEQETIAQRIVKLLNKAERAGSPEEAEAFFAKAAALQQKHAIDEMMLNAARGGQEQDKLGSKTYVLEGGYRKAYQHIIYRLAEALGGKAIELVTYDRKRTTMVVHGFESDLLSFDILYTSLIIQATRACKQHVAGLDVYSYMTAAEKFQERKSFIMGYGTGASDKVRDERRAAAKAKEADEKPGEPGVGLVLADRKTQVDQHFDQIYGKKLGTARGTKVTNGYGAGRTQGRNADTGGASRVGSGRGSKALGS